MAAEINMPTADCLLSEVWVWLLGYESEGLGGEETGKRIRIILCFLKNIFDIQKDVFDT